MKLARAEQMRLIDKTAIEEIGIPGVVLMENAGAQTARLVRQRYAPQPGARVAVFAGPGNNGGDGCVVARHLSEAGCCVELYLLMAGNDLRGDAALHLRIVRALSIPVVELLDSSAVKGVSLRDCAVAVDALFGTGLTRVIEGRFAAAVELMNNAPCPVVAIDIPSGLESDSGRVLGTAVRADMTVTYGVAKPGHFIYPGRDRVGRLFVADIGIPSRLVEAAGLECELLDEEVVNGLLAPRVADSHKGRYGHLLVAAGSQGKSGAAMLAARGALRAGSGLVTLCVGRKMSTSLQAAAPELMTHAVTGGVDGAPTLADFEEIVALMRTRQALVIGPGLGTDSSTCELVLRLYAELERPMVIDADALNALAVLGFPTAASPRVLTPHPGEMARLMGTSSKAVQDARLECAQELAKRHALWVVLKGAGTLIAAPGGALAVNSSGNPGMASGGMGDVLAGMVGGLLVQGYSPWDACRAAVYLHGRAADCLAGEIGYGFLASEVADRLPTVMREMTSRAGKRCLTCVGEAEAGFPVSETFTMGHGPCKVRKIS